MIFEISQYMFIKETTHRVLESSSIAHDQLCSYRGSRGRCTPRDSLKLMNYLNLNWTELDKYAHLVFTEDSTRSRVLCENQMSVFVEISSIWVQRTSDYSQTLGRPLLARPSSEEVRIATSIKVDRT
ncbi:hypothetical protein CSKR_105207 [Clonorchis sinensis]|uniref:Uncharacterized protein n=1 Tax=Clonorchis sinensis TaxID=79923 RepID=A0A3R7F6G7_CLOSI|nr:hypothetical protein CSKR_105207 [Clonorchis sinensis]